MGFEGLKVFVGTFFIWFFFLSFFLGAISGILSALFGFGILGKSTLGLVAPISVVIGIVGVMIFSLLNQKNKRKN